MRIGCLLLPFLLLLSCSNSKVLENGVEEKVKHGIKEFYTTSKVKEYHPISYTTLDSIAQIKNKDGSIFCTIIDVVHKFEGRKDSGAIEKHTDTLKVQIYKDAVDVTKREKSKFVPKKIIFTYGTDNFLHKMP